MSKNIGFVSTRFAGADGVTLEASKWAQVLRQVGNQCFWFCGESDRSPKRTFLVPEAYFQHPKNVLIDRQIFGRTGRPPEVTDAIHDLRTYLKIKLREFIRQFNIDLLVIENAVTIPMHVPLGLAVVEIISETQLPTIAHHHDFYWERTRFSRNAVGDYLRMAFPPNLPTLTHVVINSFAQEELALRTGVPSIIIPNIIDFENPPVINESKAREIRRHIGLEADDKMILQPTRIVQRKGIEHAIELVKELGDPRYKLVISHEAGDEGFEYAEWLSETARNKGVDLRIVKLRMSDPWNFKEEGDGGNEEKYSLMDIYPYADFITYPSLYEGFGNAFLEAIYFKKPLLINRYAIFVKDIEPQGFDLIVMDGFLTSKTIEEVRNVLESPQRRAEMVNTNYDLAMQYYSFGVLRKRLNYLLDQFFGVNL